MIRPLKQLATDETLAAVEKHPHSVFFECAGMGGRGQFLTDFWAAPAVVGRRNQHGEITTRRVGWVNLLEWMWRGPDGIIHYRERGFAWDGASKPKFSRPVMGHENRKKWLLSSLGHDGMGTRSPVIMPGPEGIHYCRVQHINISIWRAARLMEDMMLDAGSKRWRAWVTKAALRTFQPVGRAIYGESHWELLSAAPHDQGQL